ncbi:hypothetical protein ACFX13_007039 [Malus domestica]
MELLKCVTSKDQILPDVLAYNILVNGFCHGDKVDRADTVTSNVILGGLCREGRVEDALEMLENATDRGF